MNYYDRSPYDEPDFRWLERAELAYDRMKRAERRILTAAQPAADPAETPGASPSLTDESTGPAGRGA